MEIPPFPPLPLLSLLCSNIKFMSQGPILSFSAKCHERGMALYKQQQQCKEHMNPKALKAEGKAFRITLGFCCCATFRQVFFWLLGTQRREAHLAARACPNITLFNAWTMFLEFPIQFENRFVNVP